MRALPRKQALELVFPLPMLLQISSNGIKSTRKKKIKKIKLLLVCSDFDAHVFWKTFKPEAFLEREQALVDGDALFPLLSGGLGVKVAFVIVGSCNGNKWAQSNLWTGGMTLKWF